MKLLATLAPRFLWLVFRLGLFPTILLCCACHEEILPEPRSTLVVEGWIEDGDFPVVMVTRSLAVMKEAVALDDLQGYLVRWATVKVTDGQDTVTLTGKYDRRYFPPYIYTTGRMRGESGKQYALMVEYGDERLHAVTHVPERPAFDSLKVGRIAGMDSLRTLAACFRDDPSQRNYYQLFMKKGTQSRQFLATYLGNLNDHVLQDVNEVPVYPGRKITDGDEYQNYYRVGDTVSIKLAQVDSVSYVFWNGYEKKLALGKQMMFSYTRNLSGNVQGGLGYWCGYGAVTRSVVLR